MIESVMDLFDFDAVAVLRGGVMVIIYSRCLTMAQRMMLRDHLIEALSGATPTTAIAIPVGRAALMEWALCATAECRIHEHVEAAPRPLSQAS